MKLWSYLNKDDIDFYVLQHKKLKHGFNEYFRLLEFEDKVAIPKHFVTNYPSPLIKTALDPITPVKTNLEFNGELRIQQQDAINSILKIYSEKGFANGILKLPPAAGKTVIAIYLSAYLKIKTLVIVNDKGLIVQWLEKFFNFSTINKEDFGIIGDGIFKIGDVVTIAMVQTLAKKVNKKNLKIFMNSGIGLVFYDEAHNTSASLKFASTALLFPTNNIIGLTATPFKFGQGETLLKNNIGDVIYESNEYDIVPMYCIINYKSRLENHPTDTCYKKSGLPIPLKNAIAYGKNAIMKLAKYGKYLCESDSWFNIIIDYTNKFYDNDYNILLLFDKRNQVDAIYDKLIADGKTGVRKLYKNLTYYDPNNDRIICATSKKFKEAKDMPRLNAMIICFPAKLKGPLIQMIGRVLRRHPTDKRQPKVFYLNDMSFPDLIGRYKYNHLNEVKKEYPESKIEEFTDERF